MEGAGRASAGAWPSQWDASYYYSFTFCFLLTLARYLYSRGQRAWMPRIPKPRGIFIKYRLPGPTSRISDLVIWDVPNNLHVYQVPSDADAGLRTTLG